MATPYWKIYNGSKYIQIHFYFDISNSVDGIASCICVRGINAHGFGWEEECDINKHESVNTSGAQFMNID